MIKKIFSNLTFWVLLAITAGILLGHFSPSTGVAMQPLGKYFIEVIKLFINPIIFLTIVTGICGMDNLKRVGRVGGKALLYFEVVTTLALIIGVVVAYIIQPGSGVDTSSVEKVNMADYNGNVTISWAKFFKENITIQVLIFSIIAGMVISKIPAKQKIL
jgi:aerobic C4-dicarboxylate transport protein